MIIEVFKDYDQALRLFDSVRYNDNEPPRPEDFVGWQFNSTNKRDYDPYINDTAPGPQPDDTIYFDSSPGNIKLSSSVKNIVLDYRSPELVSWGGKYTAFKTQEGHSGRHTSDIWKAELVFQDDSGIDDGSFAISLNDTIAVKSSRKNSSAPYWLPEVTYNQNILEDNRAIKTTFERSAGNSSIYKVTVEIDPYWLKDEAFQSCNEYISFVEVEISIADIAGNILKCKIPVAFVLYLFDTDEVLSNIKTIKLDFIDTYPSNLFIDKDVIGKTSARAYSENTKLHDLGFEVKFGLKSDSVGYLSGMTEKYEEDGNLTSIQRIDGIDRTGNVKVFAYLEGSDQDEIFCSIPAKTIKVEIDSSLSELVKAATYVEAELGTFISECEDNTRKINIDPFIPSVLRNEEIYGLCKLYEKFLNTMYTPVGSLCRISILEKISRIGKLKDPDSCESKLLPKFFEEHGSELNFSREDLQKVAASLFNHLPDNTADSIDNILDSIYRRYAAILPYIDRWKGTERAFDLIFRAIGMDTSIDYLWENEEGELVPEGEASEDFNLSSHLRLVLNSGEYTRQEIRAMLPFAYKAAKSILPVNRVLEDIFIQDNYRIQKIDPAIVVVDASIESSDDSEKIRFSWDASSIDQADISTSKIIIKLPSRVAKCETTTTSPEYPAQDNCSFYFIRLNESNRSRIDKSLKLSFYRNGTLLTETSMSISNTRISRDRVLIEADYATDNVQAANLFNSYISDPSVTVKAAFEFNRAVDNYCISISSEEYEA